MLSHATLFASSPLSHISKWGEYINHNIPRTKNAFADGTLVRTIAPCNRVGEEGMEEWTLENCDVLHIGCGTARNHCENPEIVCSRWPMLKTLAKWEECP